MSATDEVCIVCDKIVKKHDRYKTRFKGFPAHKSCITSKTEVPKKPSKQAKEMIASLSKLRIDLGKLKTGELKDLKTDDFERARRRCGLKPKKELPEDKYWAQSKGIPIEKRSIVPTITKHIPRKLHCGNCGGEIRRSTKKRPAHNSMKIGGILFHKKCRTQEMEDIRAAYGGDTLRATETRAFDMAKDDPRLCKTTTPAELRDGENKEFDELPTAEMYKRMGLKMIPQSSRKNPELDAVEIIRRLRDKSCECYGCTQKKQSIDTAFDKDIQSYAKLGAAVACKKPNEALVWCADAGRYLALETETLWVDSEEYKKLMSEIDGYKERAEQRRKEHEEGTLFGMTQDVFFTNFIFVLFFFIFLYGTLAVTDTLLHTILNSCLLVDVWCWGSYSATH